MNKDKPSDWDKKIAQARANYQSARRGKLSLGSKFAETIAPFKHALKVVERAKGIDEDHGYEDALFYYMSDGEMDVSSNEN